MIIKQRSGPLGHARPTATHQKNGAPGGKCNRTACTTTGAGWYNTATQRWYCAACAALINGFTQADSGQPICFPRPC